MRVNPDVLAAAAVYADDPRGTPAGNAPLTQEQYDVLRCYKIIGSEAATVMIDVACVPRPADIPEAYMTVQTVKMPAVVLGKAIMGGDMRPILLMPDGTIEHPDPELAEACRAHRRLPTVSEWAGKFRTLRP